MALRAILDQTQAVRAAMSPVRRVQRADHRGARATPLPAAPSGGIRKARGVHAEPS